MTGSSPPKSDASWLGLLYQSAAAEPVHAFAERAARATLQCASVCSGLSLPASFSPEDFHLPSPILIEDAEDLNSGGASVLALKSGLSRTLLSLELLLSHGLRPGLAVAADPNGRVPSFFSSLRMAAAGAAAPAAGATGPASGLLTFWDALATLGSAAGPLDGMPEQLPGSIESVAHMDHVGSSLGRLRAWLRKLLMEKSLGQFLRFLLTHEGFLRASYEPWAAVFSEEMTNILGLLDCFASFDLLFDLRTAHAGSPAPDADFFFALDELTKLSTGTKRPAAQTPGPVVGSDSTTSLAGLRGSVDSFHGLANRTNSYSPSPELDHLDFDDTLAGDMHHHQLHHHHHHHHHGDFLEEDRLAESQLERLSLGGGANDSSGANSDGEGAAAADLAEKHNHLTEELVMVRTQLESEQSLRTSLEQEVTRLSEELALLASSAATAVADAQEQLAEAKANERTASLELELQSATEQVTSLTADVKLATERTAALEVDLQTATDRTATLETALGTASERVVTLEADLKTAAERISTLEASVEAASDTSGSVSLEADLLAATERSTTLEAELSSAAERATALEAELSSAAERATALEADLEKAAQGTAALEAQVTSATERITALEADLSSATEQASVLKADLDVATGRVSTLETDLQAATERIAMLEADVRDAQNAPVVDDTAGTAALEADLQAASERTAALEADLQAAHERVAALEAEQAGQAEQLASSQAQLASAQAETQAVRQSLADTAAEASGRIAHLEGQVSMTTERFERLAKAFSAEKARLAQLTAENEELVRRVADQASAESSAPDAAPTEDTTELQSTKDRLAEVERERDNLLAQIQTQARELEDLSTERAAVTGALDKANWLIAALTDTAQVVECVPPGADGAEESEASEGGLLPLADGKSAASRRPVGEDDITDDEPEMEAPMSEGDDELESY